MFRVEECDSEEAIERKEYDTFVNDFLHCIDSREVKAARVTRIGARSKNKDNKERPIKVTCVNPEQKREVKRKAANLKYIPE